MFLNSLFKTSQRCRLLDILRDTVINICYEKEEGFPVNFGGYVFTYPDRVVVTTACISTVNVTS